MTWDYIVVGSGSAGSVIASRLTEDPAVRVLVLEAGGTDETYFYRRPGALGLVYQVPQLKAAADWGYHTEPLAAMDGRRMPYTRGRIVGGCSTVNGMLYVRGHRADYDDWAALGNPGWGWDDLLPLFKRSEGHEDGASDAHGGDGPLQVTRQRWVSPVSRAWVEAAAVVTGAPQVDDFNTGDSLGLGLYQQTAKDRRRSSASRAFLHPWLGVRPNLELWTGCLVTRLVVEAGRVVGVELRRDGGEPVVVRAGAEVVLCAGAIGSPWILQLSGIGPADALREVGVPVVHDLPGVGANLHDHLYCPIRFTARDTGHTSTAPHFLWGMFRDWAFDDGWFGDTFLESGGFVKTDPSQPRPDLQFLTIPWAYPEPNDDVVGKGVISKEPSFTVMPIVLRPTSRGTLRLVSSDPRAAPAIDPGFLTDDADAQVLLRGLAWAREIAATAPLDRHIQSEAFPGPQARTEAALRAHLRIAGKTVYHPVGTCRMGVDDGAVVDPSLRLRGLDGLRVADASIMPVIPGGNTNAPSIAVGEKAADLIRGR